MGHPGQFVVVCDDEVTPYRVSTLYLPTGLLAGPQATVCNVEKLGYQREVWLICEGGAVIDVDRRHLLWYGAEPRHPEWLSATDRVLAHAWPGWQVRWAYNGVFDLAARVGVTDIDQATHHAYTDYFAADPVEPPEHRADPIACLVSVRATTGTVTVHPVGWPDEQLSLLARGPRLLEQLPEPLEQRRLPVPVPLTALHLDVGAKRVCVWGYEHPRELSWCWPGWQMDFRANGFADYNAVCGTKVSRPLALGWAYAAFRTILIGTGVADGVVAARIVDYLGDFLRVPEYWEYRPQEMTAALAAIDAAENAHNGP